MIKYKVLTENLDWFGIYKEDLINFLDSQDILINKTNGMLADWLVPESSKSFIKNAITTHKDWFEEIKEKEWEILEWDNDYPVTTIKQPVKVKRLSDGEVFAIGDNTNCGVIEEFEIKNDIVRACIWGMKNYHIKLKDLKHINKVQQLFTEQDMIDFGLFCHNNSKRKDKGCGWPFRYLNEWLEKRDK